MKRLCLMLLALTLLMVLGIAHADKLPEMQLHQVPNGCADSYLIVIDGHALMIDGGIDTDSNKNVESVEMFAYLEAAGLKHLDVYIATHYHNDHVGNLIELMERYGGEDTVIYGPSDELPERFAELPAGHYQQMKLNDRLTLLGMDTLCIGPQKIDNQGAINNESLNFVMTYGEKRFLFTGDGANLFMVQDHRDDITGIDVLKYPHHGLEPWLLPDSTFRLMDPSIVLIPSNGVAMLRRHLIDLKPDLQVYGITTAVVLTCDGEEIVVHDDVQFGEFPVNQ